MGNKNTVYGSNGKDVRKYVVDRVFHANGSKLYMHVEFRKGAVSGLMPVNPVTLAQNIVVVCTELDFDGVSIQF